MFLNCLMFVDLFTFGETDTGSDPYPDGFLLDWYMTTVV